MLSEQMSQVIEAQVAARGRLAGRVLELPERRSRMTVAAERMASPPGIAVEPIDVDGVPCEWIRPSEARDANVLLYFHGGGYAVGGLETHRKMIGFLVRAIRASALSAGYRLAPEHPYPAAIDDGSKVYGWLLSSGVAASDIVVAGDSSGGGLAVATCLRARESGWPMPKAMVLLSPWLDMASADDADGDEEVGDPIVSRANLRELRAWYLGDSDGDALLASPSRADLAGLPPTLIQVGEREILRDEAVLFADRLGRAGARAKCDVWDGMVHVWHFYAGWAPEADAALADIATWVSGVPDL